MQADIEKGRGGRPQVHTASAGNNFEVVVGTLGKNKLIDKLVALKKLDAKALRGKWDSYVITTLANPQKPYD